MSDDFLTTRWSVVLSAGRSESTDAGPALADLCETYWYPLYAFARRRGRDPEAARDLTQGFFAKLLEKNFVGDADPLRGRFRAFILTVFKRHMADEREKAHAQKRGGGRVPLRLDFEDGERLYALEPSHDLTPERIYDRRWALLLLERVLARLATEMEESGRADQFRELKSFLRAGSGLPSYREVAEKLSMSEGAAKTAVHRLRRRYRDLLRAEIAGTVADPAEVDDEIRQLLSALA